MKQFLTLTLLFFLSAMLFAQRDGESELPPNLKGRVVDANAKPVPYASIGIFNIADSSLATGTVSNDIGVYSIRVRPGNYYIEVSFLSYENQIIENISIQPRELTELEDIVLTPNSELLEAVDITAEKSTVELQLDKRVFNVGKDLSNTGGNAAEILSNVPSVEVDIEGNVSLRGSENVRILIDGRPSGLTGAGNSDALRMMQGNLIDKIEVITNPSSRYDAEGEVGIINIVLKKEKKKGLNGAFELTAGYPENFGASFSLNYRRKWINFFANSGITYRSSPGYGYSFNDYNGPDTSYFFENDRSQKRGGLSSVSRFGTDIYFNENNILTTALLVKFSDANNLATIGYSDFDSNRELFSSTLRDEKENEISMDLEAAVTYEKKFKQKGRSWTTNFSVNQNDDSEKSTLTQTTKGNNLNQVSYQRSNNTEDQRTYSLQSDYIHPVFEDGRFEAGFKGSIREISNVYNVELDHGNGWYTLNQFSNELVYNENIYAAYSMFSNKLSDLTYQFGLRSEYTDIETRLVATNVSNPRQYLNFFPSAHFSYELNSTNSLQLSYSRRISRPSFRELIPFFSYTDPRNFYSGNPDLNPEFSDSYELGYLRKLEKGSILSSIYYRHTTNPTERITVTDSAGLIQRFPVNLGTQDAYGVEFTFQYELYKWWRTNLSANIYQANRQGEYQDRLYSSKTFTATSRGMFIFKLPQSVDLQVSGNYQAPRISTQGKVLAMYSFDAGISKDLFKGNGTLTFSAKDLLNSRKRRWIVDTEFLYSESEFQWRVRQFLLVFTYRLNQKKSNGRGRSGEFDGSSDDM